ncbi:MAG: hypothetical protein NTW21_34565 [Verrucomicrobia bacterium]|nr:hypothetical protein [Verrucomicrobiota bacterium]
MIRFACFRWLVSLPGLLVLATVPVVVASPPWFTRSWQSDVGLPDNTVVGIAQTSDGFLWVATPSGLARFDGLRFLISISRSARPDMVLQRL